MVKAFFCSVSFGLGSFKWISFECWIRNFDAVHDSSPINLHPIFWFKKHGFLGFQPWKSIRHGVQTGLFQVLNLKRNQVSYFQDWCFPKFFETATLNNFGADLFGENQYTTVEKFFFKGSFINDVRFFWVIFDPPSPP